MESKNIELIKYNSDGMLFLSPDFVKFYKSKIMYDENLISLEKKCIFAEKFLKMLRLYSFEIIYDPIKYYCSSF